MQNMNGVDWSSKRAKFNPDETNYELRQPMETGVFPYIPKGRQQRSGLLVDILSMRGRSAGRNYIDLMMLGENRFGVLHVNIPSAAGVSNDDLLHLKSALRDQKIVDSAAATLRALDHFFSENLKSAAGVQAFYLIINQNRRMVSFSNAAHTPMIVFRPDAKKLFRLNCEGSALGLAPQAYKDFNGRMRNRLPNLKSESARIRQHDLVVLFSQGLLDARNAWGEPFGLQRFLKVLRKNGQMQPTPFLGELQNAIEQFTLGEPLQEDVTVVALKNMLPDIDANGNSEMPEIEQKFLSIEEEMQLQHTADKHPDARISEIMELLGGRYVALGHEKIRFYLSSASRQAEASEVDIDLEKPKRRFESLEKYFQRKLLQAFPVRQLLYRKYEFRGNTEVISKALEHYQNGEFKESLLEFIKARKAIAESEAVHCFFGNLYLLLNMSIKARHEYLKALKLNPKCVHAFLALGYISLLHEDYDSAINYLGTATRLDGTLEAYEQFLRELVAALDQQKGVQEWIA